jgi:hypothetical protein
MTIKTLRQRIERIQPSAPRPYVLFQEEGESDMEVTNRAAALGYPVVITPRTCRTTEEWVRTYSGPAGSGQ